VLFLISCFWLKASVCECRFFLLFLLLYVYLFLVRWFLTCIVLFGRIPQQQLPGHLLLFCNFGDDNAIPSNKNWFCNLTWNKLVLFGLRDLEKNWLEISTINCTIVYLFSLIFLLTFSLFIFNQIVLNFYFISHLFLLVLFISIHVFLSSLPSRP